MIEGHVKYKKAPLTGALFVIICSVYNCIKTIDFKIMFTYYPILQDENASLLWGYPLNQIIFTSQYVFWIIILNKILNKVYFVRSHIIKIASSVFLFNIKPCFVHTRVSASTIPILCQTKKIWNANPCSDNVLSSHTIECRGTTLRVGKKYLRNTSLFCLK